MKYCDKILVTDNSALLWLTIFTMNACLEGDILYQCLQKQYTVVTVFYI